MADDPKPVDKAYWVDVAKNALWAVATWVAKKVRKR